MFSCFLFWFVFCLGFVLFVCFVAGLFSVLFLFCFVFFSFSLCSLFFFGFFVFCLFGGFKGQVRWPKGPAHLALNPPYRFSYFLCFFFVFLCV